MTVVAGLAVSSATVALLAVVYAVPPAPAVLAALLGSVPAAIAATAVLRRRPLTSTPADRVTLTRVVLAGGCAAVTVLLLAGTVPPRSWWLLSLAVPALLLDAVDGLVARRTGTATAAGARLDAEVDAGVLVVLSLAVAPTLGAWVLLIGAMRYAFLAAAWVRPSLRAPLAYSEFRRVVAGLQGAVLAVAIAPAVPVALAAVAVLAGLLLLAASFGRDVVTLERRSRPSLRAASRTTGAVLTGAPEAAAGQR